MLDARSGVLRRLVTNFGAECTHFHLQTQIIWRKSRIDKVTQKGKGEDGRQNSSGPLVQNWRDYIWEKQAKVTDNNRHWKENGRKIWPQGGTGTHMALIEKHHSDP